MKIFGTLVHYEVKKILEKKRTWITFGILAVLLFFYVCSYWLGTAYVEGSFLETHAEGITIDTANARKLSGRAMDDKLLSELRLALDKAEEDSGLPLVYQTEIRPYKEIYSLIRSIAKEDPYTVTEESLYQIREEYVRKYWEEFKLTSSEIQYWEEKEAQIEKPFIYQYADSYQYLVNCDEIYMTCMLLTFLLAISMSGVFFEEHSRRTDQLILCSRFGRKEVYFAKLLAGGLLSFCFCVVFLGIAVISEFAILGADGFDAMLQVYVSYYSYPLTMGELFLIAAGLLLLSSVLTGIFTMVLSEGLRSNIGAMAVVLAVLFLARLLPVPADFRVLSQLWNYIPINLVKAEGLLDVRLVSLFGMKLTAWQAAPFLYVLIGALLVLIGKKLYCGCRIA
ncbi:MAG: ABC transporter permease subunit [Lachnospiraceae bacterium]